MLDDVRDDRGLATLLFATGMVGAATARAEAWRGHGRENAVATFMTATFQAVGRGVVASWLVGSAERTVQGKSFTRGKRFHTVFFPPSFQKRLVSMPRSRLALVLHTLTS